MLGLKFLARGMVRSLSLIFKFSGLMLGDNAFFELSIFAFGEKTPASNALSLAAAL